MSAKKTHGMTGAKIYKIWTTIRFRGKKCGICDEWYQSFESFHAWAIENGYKEGLCLNRLDHEKPFCPENCRWGKWRCEFGSSHCRYLTYNGETLNVSDWAKKIGIKRVTIYKRLNEGWNVEEALTTPIITEKGICRRK